MSPSTASSQNKMKLYEMFAQKQISAPPNLAPPPYLLNNPNNKDSIVDFQTTDLFSTKVEQMLIELDRLLKQSGNLPFSLLPPHHDIILVMRQIPLLINQSAQPTLLRSVVEKIVYQLYQANTSLAMEVYCRFLVTLFELSPMLAKEVTSWFIYSDDERKNDVWVITSLVKYGLLPIDEFDVKLSKQLNKNRNDARLIEFVTELIQNCALAIHPVTSIEDHVLLINALKKLDSIKGNELIQDLENRTNNLYKGVAPDVDAFSLRLYFAEWVRLCRLEVKHDDLFKDFVKEILLATTLESNKLCFFIRLCIDTSIESSKAQFIDACSKLMGYIVRLQSDYVSKIKVISSILSVAVLSLAYRCENQNVHFNQKPFLKLFTSLFLELNNSTNDNQHLNNNFIILYGNTLSTIEPLYFPGFAFSWLQLFSHRLFLPLLFTGQQSKQAICLKLMTAHLSFLQQLLKFRDQRKLTQSEKAYYHGTLRFLVVMLHDYPEFLCEHYFSLIQLVPLECIQMRNVILSAFPRSMILPDPFTASLSSDAPAPQLMEEDDITNEHEIYTLIDDYLVGTAKQSVGKSIMAYLFEEGVLNREKLQLLVFYVGSNTKLDTTKSLSENPAVQIYKYLLAHFTLSSDRYSLLNAIIDHLRYPNSHTYFFSITCLHLFTSQSEAIKELITRVLLERLIVNRPHPWGLLTTFIQMIKEPSFADHDFVKVSMHHSPDIKRLFENVLKSTH